MLQYDWVKNHLGKHWLKKFILTADKTIVKGHLLINDKVDIKGKFVYCMLH
jgi:5'-nucleotidase